MSMPDGLPAPQRQWAMLTVALAIALSVIDSSIANVALPTIARDLHAEAAASIWVVNGYQLAVTISLLPLAALGDIIGYRRIYLCGLVLFTISSLVCALSGSLTALTLARVLQGFGAAGIMSVNGALVRFLNPHHLLGRALGVTGFTVAVSSAIGPTIASAILSVAPWPWLFAVNVPLGIGAVAVGWITLPRMPRAAHSFDYPSAFLSAAATALLIAVLDMLGRDGPGWLLPMELIGFAGFAFLLVRRQQILPAPLLPVDLLRIPIFALSVGTSVTTFTAQMLGMVALPFFLQGTLGYSPVEIGLLITPWPIATAIAAPIAGRLADRYSAGLLCGLGLVLFALGLVALASLGIHAARWDIVWRMALSGIGFGFYQAPNNRTLLATAPRSRSGAAGGMLSSARLMGQTLGAALAALIFSRAPQSGPLIALYVGAIVSLLAAGVSVLRLTDPTGRLPVDIAQG